MRGGLCFVVLAIISSACLIFPRLDNTVFWDDEADVAIVSRNLLATGQLTGWDGRNLYAQYNSAVMDENFRIINPPLMYWLCAGSFRLFGATTWAGRFPFAVCGQLALIVFALLLRHDFNKDKWVLHFGLGGLAFSPVYLLFVRQCRYFAPCMLFALLFYYAYHRYLTARWRAGMALLAVSATGLFYSHYMICAAFLLATGAEHLIFHRAAFGRRDWARTVMAIVAFIAATVPYALMHRIWVRPDHIITDPALPRHLTLAWWYVRDLNLMGAIPWVFTIAILAILIRFRRDPSARMAARWVTVLVANSLFVAMLSPQLCTVTSIADARYLIAAIPLGAGLTGFLLAWINRKYHTVAWVLMITLLSSNLLFWKPGDFTFQWRLPGYLYELSHEYPTSYGEVVRFIRREAKKDDLVLVQPGFANYPVMFYVGDKVRFCCAIDDESPLAKAVERLDAPLRLEKHYPNWLVANGFNSRIADTLEYFSRWHEWNGRGLAYSYRLRAVLDILSVDMTRPEIYWHSFCPITNFDRRTEAVYIFERIDPENGG